MSEVRDSRDMTEEQEAMAEKVAKLLRLAARNTNEAEATAATIKAQEMLALYNLDLATVEKRAAGEGSTSNAGKREDAAVAGGQYQYQRDLWQSIARLNFCLYFATEQKKVRSKTRRLSDGTVVNEPRYFMQRAHRLVGRVINTTSTRTMAIYLEQTIERLCREQYPQQSQFFSRSAVSYREGLAETVIGKLEDKRYANLAADRERQRKDEAARAARGVATDKALSLAVYIDEETDANMDVINGAGWSAKQAAKRVAAAARWAEVERKQAEYDAAHPEEAAKRRKEEERELKKWRARRGRATGVGSRGGQGKPRDEQAYYAGLRDGEKIGLDPQTEHSSARTARIS